MGQPYKTRRQSSNGFLYKDGGCFSAVFLNNSDKNSDIEGGLLDSAQARITLPRFYNKDDGFANGDRIYLSPGDRIYVKDKSIDTSVSNFQEVEFEPDRENLLQFPATAQPPSLVAITEKPRSTPLPPKHFWN